jgi:hypothetical protein
LLLTPRFPQRTAVPASVDSQPSEPATERAAQRQKELREFVQNTSRELTTALEIADTVDDDAKRAKILMSVSAIQRRLGHTDDAKRTIQKARTAFREYQATRHSLWSKIKDGCLTVVAWAGKIGLGTFFSALFIKAFGHYFVESLAHKVGDEKFAKALGTTLKNTAKESGLIIPYSYQKKE